MLGRLGSEHAAERATAGLFVSRLLNRLGLTWDDVIRQPSRPSWRQEPVGGAFTTPDDGDDDTLDWRAVSEALQYVPDELSEWENRFVRSLTSKEYISAKQRRVLLEIYAKVRANRRR